jgi:hypothetical protein
MLINLIPACKIKSQLSQIKAALLSYPTSRSLQLLDSANPVSASRISLSRIW